LKNEEASGTVKEKEEYCFGTNSFEKGQLSLNFIDGQISQILHTQLTSSLAQTTQHVLDAGSLGRS